MIQHRMLPRRFYIDDIRICSENNQAVLRWTTFRVQLKPFHFQPWHVTDHGTMNVSNSRFSKIRELPTQGSPSRHGQRHLWQQFWWGFEGPEGGSDAPCHSHHAKGIPQATGTLSREACQCPNTTQAWAQVHHLRFKKEKKRQVGLIWKAFDHSNIASFLGMNET